MLRIKDLLIFNVFARQMTTDLRVSSKECNVCVFNAPPNILHTRKLKTKKIIPVNSNFTLYPKLVSNISCERLYDFNLLFNTVHTPSKLYFLQIFLLATQNKNRN